MSRGHPTRAVVFDLDGTLLDSLPLVLRAFTHAVAPFGGRPTMAMFATLGGPPERIFGDMVADPKQVPAALRRLHDYNLENQHQIEPFAGAVALLDVLAKRGIQMGVWTGRDRLSTDFLLDFHGLRTRFESIVCGDDLDSHKPDSAGLIELLRQLDVPAAHALYVGDADVDVLGGVGANVDTILISQAREARPAVASQAWRAVASPGEAYEWVMRCTAQAV